MILYYFIAVPVFLGTLIYIFSFKHVKNLAIFIQALTFAASIYTFIQVKQHGEIIAQLGGWISVAGIRLRADSISVVFLMLITLMFLLYLIFGLIEDYVTNLFIYLFIVLQSLIITMFLSSDLFNIYLVVEVSTLLVGILLMFKKDSRSIYDGIMYLLTNITGMTFFLLGIGYIYKIFGVLDIKLIGEQIAANPQIKSMLYMPFALMMTGVGLKCAIMPLFSWLPKAHGTPSAPSIVSAVLSGIYVKGGIYLFIRLRDMFEPAINIDSYFLVIGFITAMGGIIIALMQKDIKLLLAYSTIAQLGLILAGLTIGSIYSYWGAVFHIFNHAVFKSALFLTAGLIVKEYGTRNIYEIKGVFRRMPIVAISAIMAILGITGAPLFNGSVSKYFIQSNEISSLMQLLFIIINFGTILLFIKFSSIFIGPSTKRRIHISTQRYMAIIAMGAICFIGGAFGMTFINILFDVKVEVDLYSYITKSGLYLVSIIAGLVLYNNVLKDREFMTKGYSLDMSFNNVAISIFSFFVVTLFAARFLSVF